MPADMLVKLYDVEDDWSFVPKQAARGVTIRKAIGPEKRALIDWVARTFNPVWASEVDVALSNRPSTVFIAVKERAFVGFCCYDATAPGFVGPLGVAPEHRSGGTGGAVYMACLLEMKHGGHGYCILGMITEEMFSYYERLSGAQPIEGSGMSVWKTWVQPPAVPPEGPAV